jgi:DNA-binding NarL/FixJ family response regulator
MHALILSDKPNLQRQLHHMLGGLDPFVRVRRATRVPSSRPGLRGTYQPDIVFVDLAWCGMPAATHITRELRQVLASTPLVMMLDRPEEVSLARMALVQADLYVAKSAASSVVQRSLRRWVGVAPATLTGPCRQDRYFHAMAA